MHSTTSLSPFEVVYGFNPLTPLDLSTVDLPLPYLLDVGGAEKAQFVKDLHIQVQERIRRKGEQVARQVNKGRKKVVFQPGDWVWVHFRKIRFPDKTKGKLAPRGDGPFLVLERVNDNAYVIDLPGEYNVSCTFNVADLSPFDFVGSPDLRTNPFQEGEDDTILRGGPVTRSMTRRLREGLSTFVQKAMQEESMKVEEPTVRIVLKFEGGSIPPDRVEFVAPNPPGRVQLTGGVAAQVSHPTGYPYCHPPGCVVESMKIPESFTRPGGINLLLFHPAGSLVEGMIGPESFTRPGGINPL